MRILVTGCAGYIGSTLVPELIKQFKLIDGAIVGIDNLQYEDSRAALLPSLSSEVFDFVEMDLLDIDRFTEWYSKQERFDFVIHLAAIVGFPTCDKHSFITKRLHVDFIDVLTDLCNQSNSYLIYPNSNSGYGNTDGSLLCVEDTPMNPVSLYGKTKLAGEKLITSQSMAYTVLRLATVFGPSYRFRRDLLVNDFVYKAYKYGNNVIFEGDNLRNYIHIKNLCNAFIEVMQNPTKYTGNVYNLGDDDINMSKAQLAEEINKILPHVIIKNEISKDPDKRNYIVSSKKFYDTNGWRPIKGTLERGIRDLIRYYKVLDKPIYGNY